MPNIEQLCRQLGSDDQVKVYQARLELTKLVAVAGAPGKEADRPAMAKSLAELLVAEREGKDAKGAPTKSPELSVQARNHLLRYLAEVGGDGQVEAIQRSMSDFDVREMARWALTRMTAPSAVEVLATAATKGIGDEFRLGAINALGMKTGDKALAALKECLADRTPEIRLTAVEALANFPDPTLDDAITAAMGPMRGPGGPAGREGRPPAERQGQGPGQGPGPGQGGMGPLGAARGFRRVTRARLRLAANLAESGEKDAARKIYQNIAESRADDAQKKAAGAALARLG